MTTGGPRAVDRHPSRKRNADLRVERLKLDAGDEVLTVPFADPQLLQVSGPNRDLLQDWRGGHWSPL